MVAKRAVSADEFVDLLKRQFDSANTVEYNKPNDAYVVLIRGKRVSLRSGKSMWKTKGAAKSALKHHLNSIECYIDFYILKEGADITKAYPDKDYALQRQLVKQAKDEWIEQNTVVMPLSKWLQHMEKMNSK